MCTRDDIKKSLELSKESYNEDINVSGFELLEKMESYNWGVNAFVGTLHKDTFSVVFRGTDDFRSGWADLRFGKKRLPYGPRHEDKQVHIGFIDAYLEIRCKILLLYSKELSPKVLITGHSLGGAIATLCALDLQYNLKEGSMKDKKSPEKLQCITFGSPRVGNKAFVKSYNRRVPNTCRVVNGNDPATQFPKYNFQLPFKLKFPFIRSPISPYRHVHKQLRLGKRPLLCYLLVRITSLSFFLRRCGVDHDLKKYAKELKKKKLPNES
jgi:predicted lipase